MPDDFKATTIPYISYEIFARIVPGLVAIVIWFPTFLPLDNCTKSSHTGEWLLIFLAAWIIGVTMDMGVFTYGKLLRDKLSPSSQTSSEEEESEIFYKSPFSKREMIVRLAAIRVFFRSMAVVSIVTLIICLLSCIPCIYECFLSPQFRILHEHYKRYAFLSLIFAIGYTGSWCLQKKKLCPPFTDDQKTQFIELLKAKGWTLKDDAIYSPSNKLYFNDFYFGRLGPTEMRDIFTQRAVRIECSKKPDWNEAAKEFEDVALAAKKVITPKQ